MVIIQLWGGIGNQMFEYALYRSYADKGVKVKLEWSAKKNKISYEKYKLKRVFDIDAEFCSSTEKAFIKPISKLFYKLSGRPYKETSATFGYYDKRVNDLRWGYLKGYWQCEEYFKEVEPAVRAAFRFPALTDERNIILTKKIEATNSVSVHIRRGDYLHTSRNWAMDIAYYKNALEFISGKINGVHLFIFSDDIDWAKENIKQDNAIFIDWNTGKNSYIDMQLMSACKHNIIANSSFSWWGAWLNANPEKIVIAPDTWVNMKGTRDILPASWIQLAIK
jgi:hypothetical protein